VVASLTAFCPCLGLFGGLFGALGSGIYFGLE
jgi:hypothetical protein